MTKPTPAQMAAMKSLAAGLAPTAHLRTVREVRDCESKTLPSLLQRGWIDHGGFLTDAGRVALNADRA